MASAHRISIPQVGPQDYSGEDIWRAYLGSAEDDGNALSTYSATTMSSMLTFVRIHALSRLLQRLIGEQAGLFSAVVAAALVESYKYLLPDTGDQTVVLLAQIASGSAGNETQAEQATDSFRPSTTAIVINTLWISALIVALMSGLLATLVQEWSRRFLRAQARSPGVSLEHHSRRQLRLHMGVKRYGLDRIASVIVALMHAAVILFLIGIDIVLFKIHNGPAIAATVLTALGALFYAITSSIPLFDEDCPYYTPLTQFLVLTIIVPSSTAICIIAYILIALCAAFSRAKMGYLDPGWHDLLRLSFVWGFMREPLSTLRILRGAMAYYVAPYTAGSRRPTTFRDYLSQITWDEQGAEDTASLNEKEWTFLWNHVGNHILERPCCLQWVGNCLVNLQSKGFGATFVAIRTNPYAVAKIAAALSNVGSVFAAVGSVRVLQALLQAETSADEMSQVDSDGDARWETMDPIIDALGTFVERLDEVNVRASAQKDASVLEALSELRWLLLQLWNRLPVDDRTFSYARRQVQRMLGALDRDNTGIRLLPLSEGTADGTFTRDEDRRLEIAQNNAFTLLVALHRTKGTDYWGSLNTPFVNSEKNGLNLWRWKEVYADAIGRRRRPLASDAFRNFLQEVHGDPELNFADLHPVARRILRDLTSVVDLGAAIDRESKPPEGPSQAIVLLDGSGSSAFSGVEEVTLNSVT